METKIKCESCEGIRTIPVLFGNFGMGFTCPHCGALNKIEKSEILNFFRNILLILPVVAFFYFSEDRGYFLDFRLLLLLLIFPYAAYVTTLNLLFFNVAIRKKKIIAS